MKPVADAYVTYVTADHDQLSHLNLWRWTMSLRTLVEGFPSYLLTFAFHTLVNKIDQVLPGIIIVTSLALVPHSRSGCPATLKSARLAQCRGRMWRTTDSRDFRLLRLEAQSWPLYEGRENKRHRTCTKTAKSPSTTRMTTCWPYPTKATSRPHAR